MSDEDDDKLSARYKVKGKVHVSRPVAYNFSFAPSGWMIATVNDATGELTIRSDWVNCAHRWNVNAIGTATLHDFLLKADIPYLVGKLALGDANLKNEYNPEATLELARQTVCERRREGRLKKEEARELWDELKVWEEEGAQTYSYGAILQDFLEGIPFQYRPPFGVTALKELLLPTLREYLKKQKE